MSCNEPVTNLCTPLNDSVSFNCSTFYQCSATAFLSVSHHQSSFVPLKRSSTFLDFTSTSVCSCFNGVYGNCVKSVPMHHALFCFCLCQ